MITAMAPEPSDEVVQQLYESLDEEMLLGATEVLLEEGAFFGGRVHGTFPSVPPLYFAQNSIRSGSV
jgi:hypothetical protein